MHCHSANVDILFMLLNKLRVLPASAFLYFIPGIVKMCE
jgi:hypothetical protein